MQQQHQPRPGQNRSVTILERCQDLLDRPMTPLSSRQFLLYREGSKTVQLYFNGNGDLTLEVDTGDFQHRLTSRIHELTFPVASAEQEICFMLLAVAMREPRQRSGTYLPPLVDNSFPALRSLKGQIVDYLYAGSDKPLLECSASDESGFRTLSLVLQRDPKQSVITSVRLRVDSTNFGTGTGIVDGDNVVEFAQSGYGGSANGGGRHPRIYAALKLLANAMGNK